MTNEIQYDPSVAHKLLKTSHLKEIEPDILSAREEIAQDVELLISNQEVPAEKQPLDAGFINLPADLLDTYKRNRPDSLPGRIESTASQLRNDIDRLVVLGIGGSYMGARALFEALCHPFHNELPREERQQIPRITFAGNNLDNDVTCGLLELLSLTCRDNNDVGQRWGITVISKSGGPISDNREISSDILFSKSPW